MPTLTRTTLDVLRDARDLLTPPERWTKDALAREAGGKARGRTDIPEAVCFCAVGAVERVIGPAYDRGLQSPTLGALRDAVAKDPRAFCPAVGRASVPRFNDHPATTHGDVLAAFDKAIATQVKDAA